MSQVLDFLRALYEDDELAAGHLLLWTSKGKRSKWFSDLRDAATYAQSVTDKDLYFGVGLSAEQKGQHKRADYHEISAIPGLWLDLDYAHEGHSKPNLPPDRGTAMASLVEIAPLQPTIIVHTGGGFHVYWLFKEPYLIETDLERREMAALCRGWQAYFQSKFRARGMDIDSTADLPRVLRLPGTFNLKNPEKPVQAQVEEFHTHRRYNPEDFVAPLEANLEEYAENVKAPGGKSLDIVARRGETSRSRKLRLFLDTATEEDERFRRTWTYNRPDLQDQSMSSYDMALARACAENEGLDDQDIADVLVDFRERNAKTEKDRKKAYRIDYLSITIITARESFEKERQRQEAQRRIREAELLAKEKEIIKVTGKEKPAEQGEEAPPPVKDEAKKDWQEQEMEEIESQRRSRLETVSELIGVDVVNIIKYLSEPPIYEFHLNIEGAPCKVTFEGVAKITELKQFRNKIAEATDYLIKRVKSDEWDNAVAEMLRATVKVVTGKETRAEGLLDEYLRTYLSEKQPTEDPESVKMGLPNLYNSQVYIQITDFKTWLAARGSRYADSELTIELQVHLGAINKNRYYYNDDGVRKGKSYYRLPEQYNEGFLSGPSERPIPSEEGDACRVQ